MFDNMFGNIGKKIMNYVKVITGIGFAVSIIGGLFIMVSVPLGGGVLAGLLIAAFGCLFAWINGFILYGFGKLIDNTEQLNGLDSMRESLDTLNYSVSCLIQLQQGSVQNTAQESTVNTGNAFMGQKQEEVYREEEPAVEIEGKQQECSEVFSFPAREEGDIYCPNCGSKQRGNRDKCRECGAGFVYEDEQ